MADVDRENFGVPVLSSPKLGLQAALQRLAASA